MFIGTYVTENFSLKGSCFKEQLMFIGIHD